MKKQNNNTFPSPFGVHVLKYRGKAMNLSAKTGFRPLSGFMF